MGTKNLFVESMTVECHQYQRRALRGWTFRAARSTGTWMDEQAGLFKRSSLRSGIGLVNTVLIRAGFASYKVNVRLVVLLPKNVSTKN